MLVVGSIFITLAILFGIIILNAILKNKRTPKPMVFLHGAFALFAILVLIGFVAAGNTDGLLIGALAILVIAALGGLYVFTIDMKKQTIPKIVVLLHALLALGGFGVLIYFMMHREVIS